MITPDDDREDEVFDAIVIGTGFAGAVTAARLVEAGQRICVLERGRKYEGNDFPMYPDAEALLDIDGGTKPSGAAPDLARWLWSIDQGIYDVRDLDDVVSVQAAGYGGGSLIYANVHLRAPNEVFQQGWPAPYDRPTLDPYYDRVAYMLDVRPMPPGQTLRKTEQLKGLAKQLKDVNGAANLVRAIDPPLAVTFATGEHAPGLSKDEHEKAKAEREKERPWTEGERRLRGPCDMRGQCWLGCRQGAKNSLDFNYLRIVENGTDDHGDQLAHIHLGAEVQKIERIEADGEPGGGYTVHYRDHLTAANNGTPSTSGELKSYRANYVFLAAGAVNTTELLIRSKKHLKRSASYSYDVKDHWPELGARYFPNADSLAAVFDCKEPQDADHGPTITSALLHQKPRRTVEAGADKDKAQERYLWAIDFRPTDEVAEETVAALTPDALIQVGTSIGSKPDPSDEITRLVEPPIFDVGGFNETPAVAMLVLEGSGKLGQLAGKTLLVRQEDGAFHPFGTIIGQARKLEDWFLIEDGGYPTDIEPFLGILRSPLWLRRNRFIEPADADPQAVERRKLIASESGPLPFPLATAMEAFFGVPRRSTRVSTGLDDISENDVLLAASPLQMSLKEMLPAWFRDALVEDRADLAKAVAPIVGQMLEAMLDDVAEQLVNRFDAMALAGNFSEDVIQTLGTVPKERRADLVRGMLRQTIQLLWGSEVALAARVNQLLLDRIPKDAYSLAQALAPLAGWLLNYREGNGRTALLLTMGRDQYRGRLSIDEKSDRLTATLPKPLAPTSRVAQEQVLRSIASTWQGELRTNPAWAALNRRITVHSQGGCPMCTCPDRDGLDDKSTCVCMAVTKPDGEVVGCDGLYVMDAAAFPTAVGVNPSATIAAVAEYKIETFIKNVLAKDQASSKQDDWIAAWNEKRQPKEDNVKKWIEALKHDYGDEHVLDPLGTIGTNETGKPASRSLGLKFEESISGLFIDVPKKESKSVIDWEKLTGFDDGKGRFEQAERQGMEQNSLLTLKLTATIDDLDRFFRTQHKGLATKIGLSGQIDLGGGLAYDVDPSQSYLQMFYRPASANNAVGHVRKPKRQCFFRYCLVSKDPKHRFWIDAAKVLSDESRFDVWHDLATLYFEWCEGEQHDPKPKEVHRRGIIRLAPFEFFQKQLQSISITPTGADPARKSWAYIGFINYFADEVASVYLERRGQIKAMVKNLLDARGG